LITGAIYYARISLNGYTCLKCIHVHGAAYLEWYPEKLKDFGTVYRKKRGLMTTLKLAVPKFRLHNTGNTLHAYAFGKCIQIYNKVPLNVTKLPLHKLKQTVKETFMKQGYYKVEDYLEDKNIWK
jgi:hypothetical protein